MEGPPESAIRAAGTGAPAAPSAHRLEARQQQQQQQQQERQAPWELSESGRGMVGHNHSVPHADLVIQSGGARAPADKPLARRNSGTDAGNPIRSVGRRHNQHQHRTGRIPMDEQSAPAQFSSSAGVQRRSRASPKDALPGTPSVSPTVRQRRSSSSSVPASSAMSVKATWASQRSDISEPRSGGSTSSSTSGSDRSSAHSAKRRHSSVSSYDTRSGTVYAVSRASDQQYTLPAVVFGAPILNSGNKYVQRMSALTPSDTVTPLDSSVKSRRDAKTAVIETRVAADYGARLLSRSLGPARPSQTNPDGASQSDSDSSSSPSSGFAHHSRSDAKSGRRRRHKRRRESRYGARMEDNAVVLKRMGTGGSVSLAIVADGHGSVPMISRHFGSKEQSRHSVFVGGTECAALAAACLARYMARVADLVDIRGLARKGVACVLRDAFLFAQRICSEETVRGCLDDTDDHHADRSDDRSTGGTSSSSSRKRRRASGTTEASSVGHAGARMRRRIGGRLTESAIDGAYFARVQGTEGTELRRSTHPSTLIVVDKVRVPYRPIGTNGCMGPPGHLVYYVTSTGKRTLAEYGTTLSAVLTVPLLPSDVARGRQRTWTARAFVAHAGDSDAYLFYRVQESNGATPGVRMVYRALRLTENHSMSNVNEVKRLEPYGVTARHPYFTVTTGREAHQQSLMPSRSLGHVLLSQHRITATPSISTVLMAPGDIVVVASDGLWGCYGGACGLSAERHLSAPSTTADEDLSAMAVGCLLDTMADGIVRGTVGPTEIGHAIMHDLARRYPHGRDNGSIVVGVCPPLATRLLMPDAIASPLPRPLTHQGQRHPVPRHIRT